MIVAQEWSLAQCECKAAESKAQRSPGNQLLTPIQSGVITIMPKVKLVKTLWGVDEPISSSLFESILAEGYAGVEVIALAYSSQSAEEVLVEAANTAGLTVIFQIHTSGGYIDSANGEYVYIDSYDVQVGAVLFMCATELRPTTSRTSF